MPLDPYNLYWWTAVGTVAVALATFILTLATVAQVFVTRSVAVELKRASEIREIQSNARYVNQQWQRLNLLAATNSPYISFAQKIYEKDIPAEDVPVRGIVFYILNLIYDMYYAKDGYIDKSFYRAMVIDHVRLLVLAQKPLLLQVLDGNRGYSPDFQRYIHEIIKEIEAGRSDKDAQVQPTTNP